MKIAVLIKRVPDTASVIKISPDNKSIVTDGLKYVLNPYDEHGVEEAVKIKEAGEAEVVAFCAGNEGCKETIRMALAMGADSAVLIKDDGFASASAKGIAKALAAAIKAFSPDLIFAGKQAVDDDAAQIAERVAENLALPHVSMVTKLEVSGNTAKAEREVEGGHLVLEVNTPALFTLQKGINKPRYPSLPNIMKAKKKEIKEVDLASLEVKPEDLASGIEVIELEPPKQERKKKIIEGDNAERAKELVRILKEEEKVL